MISSPDRRERPRVLLVQRIVPHYRVRLFQELCSHPEFELVVAHGEPSRHSHLHCPPIPPGVRSLPLRNYYLHHGSEERLCVQRGLLRLLRSGRFDIVIAEFSPRILSNLAAFLYTRMKGMKFIWWGHGMSADSASWIFNLRLALAKRADATIFYESNRAVRFRERGLASSRIFIASNTLDTNEISKHVAQTPFHQRSDVLYIGRLIAFKKVDLLIRGFAEFRKCSNPSNRLTIVGDGPELEPLKDLARSCGIADSVEFTGGVYDEPVLATYFNRAWVSVVPAIAGLGIIHSMSYGVPLLVSRAGPHNPEIAYAFEKGRAGLAFSDDAGDLAERLSELRLGAETWETLSRNCIEISRRYTVEGMASVFSEAILSVENGSQTPQGQSPA